MTVGELINELKNYDEDIEVFFWDHEADGMSIDFVEPKCVRFRSNSEAVVYFKESSSSQKADAVLLS